MLIIIILKYIHDRYLPASPQSAQVVLPGILLIILTTVSFARSFVNPSWCFVCALSNDKDIPLRIASFHSLKLSSVSAWNINGFFNPGVTICKRRCAKDFSFSFSGKTCFKVQTFKSNTSGGDYYKINKYKYKYYLTC